MHLLRKISLLVLFISLISCGDNTSGGFGTGSEGDGDTGNYEVSLTISSSNVTPGNPATVSALVKDNGTAVTEQLVTFTVSGDLATLTPESGTALTDNAGVASIIINAGDISGAGLVTVTVAGGDTEVIGFTTEAAATVTLRLGTGTGASFVEGEIAATSVELSAGGTSSISVNIVDDAAELYAESAQVNFTSACVVNGTASMDSPVASFQGLAVSTYLAKGCTGEDTITVNALVGNQNLIATGVINVLKANIGSIIFESATPDIIAIKGSGGGIRPESSEVMFQVLDKNSNPVSNTNVVFDLSSDIGGVTIDPLVATSNAEGFVRTVITAGSVQTAVSVIASVEDNPLITTSSSSLKVATGLADQDSFTLAVEVHNVYAWNYVGTEVNVTARLADSNNNPPVPTTITFRTEGGSIDTRDSSCLTGEDGSCSVTWRSQSPYPEGNELGDSDLPQLPLAGNENVLGRNYGGRSTIVAHAIGEETFPDINSNGVFDSCEIAAFLKQPGKPCDADGFPDTSAADIDYPSLDVFKDRPDFDIGEPYSDDNENHVYDYGEWFGDHNKSGSYDGPDGKYNGTKCATPAHEGCSINTTTFISDTNTIIMSGYQPKYNIITPNLNLAPDEIQTASVIVSDFHNQPLAHDVEISWAIDGDGSLAGADTGVWGNDDSNGGRLLSASVKAPDEPGSGILSLILTYPDGREIRQTIANITISTL